MKSITTLLKLSQLLIRVQNWMPHQSSYFTACCSKQTESRFLQLALLLFKLLEARYIQWFAIEILQQVFRKTFGYFDHHLKRIQKQCTKRIFNKIAKQFKKTFEGLKCMLQGFRIYLEWNPRLKGIYKLGT